MARAYYNEIDTYAAQYLRNLIKEGLIADGDVDTRSIVDVRPADLKNYTQCHFFAGLGGWSGALRLSGIWPDRRPVWSGSCPCQPFSLAGKQGGFADERHLWPYWQYLIEQCRPAVVFGEQVASASKWLGLVRSDLEAMDYAVGCMPIEAASAGADHLRDRYWFVAHGISERESTQRSISNWTQPESNGTGTSVLADDPSFGRRERRIEHAIQQRNGAAIAGSSGFFMENNDSGGFGGSRVCPEQPRRTEVVGASQANSSMAKSNFFSQSEGWQQRSGEFGRIGCDQETRSSGVPSDTFISADLGSEPRTEQRNLSGSGSENCTYEWVIGADGKARRTKPGIRLLANGIPARVAKLRTIGNAIDLRPAAEFIRAYDETLDR